MGLYRAALVWFERYHACVQQDPRSCLPAPGVENTEFVNAAVKQAVMSVRSFPVSFFIGIILILLTLRLDSRPLLNILTVLFILGDMFFCGKIRAKILVAN